MSGSCTRARAWLLALALLAAPAAPAAGLGPAQLGERIERFVLERATGASRVVVPALADFDVPTGTSEPVEVRLSVNPRERFEGSAAVGVSLWAAGRELRRGVVNVRVERDASWFVATRSLPAQTTVRAQDLRTVAAGDGRVPPGALEDPARIVGRRTTRAVSAGAPWRAELLAERLAVSRGAQVRLRLEQRGLRIEASGRAREDGRLGDRVRVLNVESRREVVGTVAGEGIVDVAF